MCQDQVGGPVHVSACRTSQSHASPPHFGEVESNKPYTFSDASKDARGTAIYLRQFNRNGEVSVALALGQAKVAPIHP